MIARIFNTYGPRMRRNDGRASVELHQSGARGQAAHRLRRRLADAFALLRRRPDPRALPARDERRAPAGQPRQPRSRGDDARACADGDQASRARRARSCSKRFRPTTRRSAARHHARAPGARLAARDRPRGRARRWLASSAGRRSQPECSARRGHRRRRRWWRRSPVRPRVRRTRRGSCASGSTTRRRRSTARSTQTFRSSTSCTCRRCALNLYWGGPYGVAQDAPGPRDEPGRPGLQLGALRPHGQLRARSTA